MAQFGADFGGSMPEYYDRFLGPAQFDAFGEDIAARLPTQPPGAVLEVACGTGRVSAKLRARLASAVRLVATDLSGEMLAYARSRVPGDIEWKVADAAALPFDSGRFAAVVCSFGIMFVPDKHRAFSEMRRVLRKGGALLFNVWDRIERNVHARTMSEVTEGLFPGDADMQAGRTPFLFNDRGLIGSMLKDAGFGEVRSHDVAITVSAPSAREFATGSLRGTPRYLQLEKRGVDVEQVIEKAALALARVGGERPFKVPGHAIVFEAQAA